MNYNYFIEINCKFVAGFVRFRSATDSYYNHILRESANSIVRLWSVEDGIIMSNDPE